ncbi:hypothetical protein HWV62_5097 [Athelia sp. TMB]|nr:hypothetical protein HWV62_5097 [Athelia sp. TMB]
MKSKAGKKPRGKFSIFETQWVLTDDIRNPIGDRPAKPPNTFIVFKSHLLEQRLEGDLPAENSAGAPQGIASDIGADDLGIRDLGVTTTGRDYHDEPADAPLCVIHVNVTNPFLPVTESIEYAGDVSSMLAGCMDTLTLFSYPVN